MADSFRAKLIRLAHDLPQGDRSAILAILQKNARGGMGAVIVDAWKGWLMGGVVKEFTRMTGLSESMGQFRGTMTVNDEEIPVFTSMALTSLTYGIKGMYATEYTMTGSVKRGRQRGEVDPHLRWEGRRAPGGTENLHGDCEAPPLDRPTARGLVRAPFASL